MNKNQKELSTKSIKSNEEDLKAIEAVKAGNLKEFEHIVKKYETVIHVKAVRALKDEDDAKDVTQDILVKVMCSVDKFKPEYTFNSWITRVSDNFILDVIRHRKQDINNISIDEGFMSPDRMSPAPFEIADEVPNDIEDSEEYLYKKLKKALLEFDEKDQNILEMFMFKKMQQKEIAEIVGLSHANVRVRVLRLKEKLISIMKDSNYAIA